MFIYTVCTCMLLYYLFDVTNSCFMGFFLFRFFVPNILILKETSTVDLFFLQARILIFKVMHIK